MKERFLNENGVMIEGDSVDAIIKGEMVRVDDDLNLFFIKEFV